MTFSMQSGRMAAAAIFLTAAVANAALIHRFSFTDAAGKDGVTKDSVGKAEGTLKGDATIADGKLTLKNDDKTSDDAALSYLEFNQSLLPKGDTVSIAVWFKAKAGGNFPRVINFGDKVDAQGQAFIYLTPAIGGGGTRSAITATDAASKTAVDSDPLDDDKEHLVVLVVDGKAKKLKVYVDGKSAGDPADLGDNTLDKVKAVNNWIGRSSFDQDTGLNGSVNELRVFDHAVSADEAAAMFKSGADKLPEAATQPATK